MIKIEKQRSFSSEHDYSAFSVVRLHAKVLKQLGGRNTWVKISNGPSHIYRLAKGKAPTSGFTMKCLEIDYESHLELGKSQEFQPKCKDNFYPCSLTVEKANFIGKFIAHWKHPDPGYRVPMQLSIVGFFLGLTGLFLGVLGYA